MAVTYILFREELLDFRDDISDNNLAFRFDTPEHTSVAVIIH